jgi:hypothetical protein
MSRAGVSATRLDKVEEQVFQRFFTCYNSISKKQRLILMIDTIEVVQNSPVIDWLIENTSQFRNTVFLLAGRQNLRLYERITKTTDKKRVMLLELQPFDTTETQELFSISEVGALLTTNVSEKVRILSGGHPILLALALERGKHAQDEELTPTVAHYTVADLSRMDNDTLNSVQTQFERELVESLTVLDPKSQLLFYMAYIHRRFDAEVLAFLQSISESEARSMINDIRDYSFVKYFEDTGECYLHDEMRRLVVEYVCREIDRGWQQRKELAHRMAALDAEERLATRQLFEGGQIEADLTQS